ncbi:pentatricopeptide repeat-containing protein At2g22410, mitochondrial-like [Carex rostrata]
MHLPSALRSAITKPTITLSLLETHLAKCYTSPKLLPQILAQATISGLINDTYAASRIISLCTTSLFFPFHFSRLLLQQIKSPNGFILNSVMRGAIKRNFPHYCIPLYSYLITEELEVVDKCTYPILLHACAIRGCEVEGKEIHNHVLKMGFECDVYVVNTLISMYSVCGNLQDARKVFDRSPVLDSVSWNSMLAAYIQLGDVNESVEIFNRMPEKEKDAFTSNSMITLFGKSNRVEAAEKLFDEMGYKDIVSWSAMISCYEQSGMIVKALEMFSEMNKEFRLVDDVLMVTILSACAQIGVVRQGEIIHVFIMKLGLDAYNNIQNALIHMYSSYKNADSAKKIFKSSDNLDQISWNSMLSSYIKCGQIEDAKLLFSTMPQRNTVTWNTMVSGYAQNYYFKEALELFDQMLIEGMRPDETALVSVLSACARMSALELGRWVHMYIGKQRYKQDEFLSTALIDMYMKCGCMPEALEVFNFSGERGVSTWNALILGLALNGLVKESIEKFSCMEQCGVVPNEITFVGVMSACRFAGLVQEGRFYFNLMQERYKIAPNITHFGCMVDLLGRAGFVKEAEALIQSMPFSPDNSTWGALLCACKKHGETRIGERIGRKLIELEPSHDGFHVLLSNMYAEKGKWDNLTDVRSLMKQRNMSKVPGSSMINYSSLKTRYHTFMS